MMEIRGGRKHAENWINGVFNDDNKPRVSQCLNDIEGMGAWDGSAVTGIVTNIYVSELNNGNAKHRLYHVSAGIAGTNKTCTLFFIRDVELNAANVIGVYQHVSSTTYQKVWKSEHYDLSDTISLG